MIFKAIHIYPNSNQSLDELLSKLFIKIDQCELTNKFNWFFVRYFDDDGLHIRLRIQDLAIKSSGFQKLISEFNFKWMPYLPEIDRYGGEGNMTQCEFFFIRSSCLVKNIYIENKSINYENRLLFAISINILIYKTNLTKNEFRKANNTFFKEWLNYNSSILKIDKVDLVNSFELAYSKQISNNLIHNVKEILEYFQHILDKEFLLIELRCPINRKIGIINSIIHMSNNRLGINNQDESYLSFLTTKIMLEK